MKKATEGEPDPMTDGLTRDQRFFLNWATVWRRNFTPDELKVRLTTDPPPPANFRATAAPPNMPVFPEASACKPGAAMVRGADKRVVPCGCPDRKSDGVGTRVSVRVGLVGRGPIKKKTK